MVSRRRHYLGIALRLLVVLGTLYLLPRWWCGRAAGDYFDGERAIHLALARNVAHSVESGVTTTSFSTGNPRFDGEWTLGTYQMSALGLAQVILEHPETREELLPALDAAVARLQRPDIYRFGVAAWRENGLESLSSDNGHAYLGYVNLALGMDRMVRPDSPHADLHDRLTEALVRRLKASPTGMIQTYPHETYPPDVSSVVGSIGLHGRVTGTDHGDLVTRWAAKVRERYVQRPSGLLVQCVNTRDGTPLDRPRASGTALAAYFLSFADRTISRDLYGALQRNRSTLAGFGGIREYPRGTFGLGDVDSGPVLLGIGLSATGFSMSGARIHGDRETFRALYRTAHLFGGPVSRGNGTHFVTGGPLGNAIMLAMLTAGPGAAPPGGER